MIQDADLKRKLILQADIFQHHYRKKEYAEAKLTRERAGTAKKSPRKAA